MRRPLRSLRRNRKAAASDALEVYEAKGWPDGKVPGGKG